MTAFATPTDLAALLQQTVDTSSATLALDVASARIRKAIRRTLTSGTYTQTFESFTDSALELRERPVSAITSVTVDGETVTDYTLIGSTLHRSGGWGPIPGTATLTGNRPWLGSGYFTQIPVIVTVVYTGGYATVPDDIKGLCLAWAGAIYSDPSGRVTSEKIDDYAVTFSSGDAGSVSAADRDILRAYRRGAFTVPQ